MDNTPNSFRIFDSPLKTLWPNPLNLICFQYFCRMWIYWGLLAAVFLGLHNITKKISVRENAVFPVLFFTTLSSLGVLVPLFIGSVCFPEVLQSWGIFIPSLPWEQHFYIFIKSAIMCGSWILGYSAMKHLPITIVSPIRSAGPFFTLLGALSIYGERPNTWQWLGFALIIGGMLWYSRVGKKEGIDFKRDKWIFAIIGATFLGSGSGLYDKFLVHYQHLNAQTVQFWFCFYIVALMALVCLFYRWKSPEKVTGFDWRWSILATGIGIVIADFCYFRGLEDPSAMIMLLSAIKRSQIFISVFVGGWIFKERNKRKKMLPLFAVLLGVGLILYAS
ncbi:permease [Persicobacter psychrovividus]|uniref:Permease n=2 Tax=Persicobacter psychrovividus TaxID=387638 RepID=A0ABN6LA72_9BACT|nr:permease [Persicobacter psychrovividus]